MVGNYIDFGALENVNEGELKAQLDEAININIDSKLLDVLKRFGQCEKAGLFYR